jgi:glycosyltransferase 2 family protein
MAEENHPIQAPRIRIWRYLPLLIILGLAVHLLVPQITTLQNSWSVVRKMTWWAVALAAVAQSLSYVGSGYMLHSILTNNRQKLSTLRGALITMAAYSVGLVAGGWVGGAAATYGWVRRESHDGNTAALCGTLPPMLNNVILVVVALVGTTYLLVVHALTRTQLIEFSVILLVLGLVGVGALMALRYPEPVTRLAVWLAGRWAALRRKPFSSENTVESVNQLVVAWESLGKGRWLHPLLGAVANIGFDMLTLYFIFVAAGYKVSPGVLFAGYGLPFILGKIAFMFPGGVGVIEGSMVALYDSLQVPNAISVVVILGYRLFSFWLPTLLGFLAAAYLGERFSGTERKKSIPD